MHFPAVTLMFALGICLFVMPERHAKAEIDAAIVQRSIDRGITYLRKTQTNRGHWDEFSLQSCGATALCTLALVNAGVPYDDPVVTRAMRYLRTIEPNETYSIALQTLVFCHVGSAGDIQLIRRNVQALIDIQKTAENSGPNRIGSWGYGGGRVSSGDPSNTQFALLALGAAQDRGIEIDAAVFERTLEYWQNKQRRDHAWSYVNQQPASGSMTCAGIASVLIARGGIQTGNSQSQPGQIACCGNDQEQSDQEQGDPVELAMDWLGEHFSVDLNPGGQSHTYYYYLYALERVGRLSGRRFIGQHDWYREGAERLVGLQDQFEGFWAGSGWEEDRNVSTSFALLFLSKGKRQVVVGRLRHGDDSGGADGKKTVDNGGGHPDALRQLVRHVERDWGRDLTWQTIQADRATVEDLLQAPVIVISGRDELKFTDGQADRLKRYIDQGGTILFEAEAGDGCGDASPFTRSVVRMCDQWFPGSKMERLPPSHPVWFAEHKVDPKQLQVMGPDFWVYGIQACCRTAVFFSPKSLSCRWELGGAIHRRRDKDSPIRQQVELSVRIGQNVIAYATGRELKDKLQRRTVIGGSELPESTRGVTQMALLSLDAGGLEAQRALSNVAAIIRQSRPMFVSAVPEPVAFQADQLEQLPVLWIHGRTEFTLDETQRKVLRDFIGSYGIIFATSICGSESFSESFRREMSAVLPDTQLKRLPAGHPMLTKSFGGYDISTLEIRKPTNTGQGITVSRHPASPQLEVATVDGVVSVFFSPLDVSCALESQNSVQCHGYDTADAAKIVANVLLYALNQ